MEQIYDNTKRKKGKHLNYEERIKIETLFKEGLNNKEISERIGCCERTIKRELKRGEVMLLNSDYTYRLSYSADIAQKDYDIKATAKGAQIKIGKDFKLAEYIEDCIVNKKYSPYAVVESIKNNDKVQFETTLCYKTIYNYIDEGLFLNVSNKDLPVKKDKKKKKHKRVRIALNNTRGTSISERPKEIDKRESYGHWELDTVVGKQGTKTVLLVLTERMTRQEIIIKMAAKSEKCVVAALNKTERKMGAKKFKKTFKSITCDNGCENLDFEGMEQSIFGKGKRTKIYYAHPYSAWERGSNENANRIIRRFVPKGTDLSILTNEQVKMIENWINNYPRRILNGKTANMLLREIKSA